jgi:nucleoside-diphosphate-sugar epimerase
LNILLTGGSGFLGRSLIPFLSSHTIYLLGRKFPEQFINLTNLHFLQHDISSESKIVCEEKIDLIIHLAAIASGEGKSEDEYFLTNTLGTQKIIDFAKSANVKKIIFASSVSVYGSSGKKFGILESDSLLGKTAYAKSKIEAEKIVQSSGISFIILRIASVYGKGSKGFIHKLVRLCNKGLAPFPCIKNNKKSFIHISDLTHFIASIIDKNIDGIFNVSNPEEMEYTYLLNSIIKYSKEKNNRLAFIKIPLPSFALNLSNVYRKITGKDIGLAPLFEQFTVSSEKAMLEAGFKPEKTILNGIKEEIF